MAATGGNFFAWFFWYWTVLPALFLTGFLLLVALFLRGCAAIEIWMRSGKNQVSPIDKVANQNADTDAAWASEKAAHYALQGWQHDLAPQFED